MSGDEGETRAKGGLVHQIFRWSFFGFNLLMLVWLVSYIASTGKLKAAAASAADKATLAQAIAVGGGVVLGVWLFGAVLLGLLSSLTRPRKPGESR